MNKKNKTKIVKADNNEENVYEKIILQDAKHDDNIDLDGVCRGERPKNTYL